MILGNGAGGKRRHRRNVDVSDGGSAAERAVVSAWVDTPGPWAALPFCGGHES
jgi:hypothetical protein